MSERYTRPEMAESWSDDTRYQLWTRIEVAVCRALCARGRIPKDAFDRIESSARVDPARVLEIEARVHHDVNAYLDALAEVVGPAARYVHLGLPSSDVLDTCLALQLRDATELVLAHLRQHGPKTNDVRHRHYPVLVAAGRQHVSLHVRIRIKVPPL